MPDTAAVSGTACDINRRLNASIDASVRTVVLAALSDAGLGSLDEIDAIVSIGSDILDATTVAGHSGVAGSYGKSLMTFSSSSGHALASAVAMIESGAASTVLLVGWGEGSKFAEIDGRIIQADPFYARPLGAGAAELAVLQAQRLLAEGRLDPSLVTEHASAILSRTNLANDLEGPPAWLRTHWCDGACALVLTGRPSGQRAVAVVDVGTSFQPYCPEPEDLDPERWVGAARLAMRSPRSLTRGNLVAVGVSGPTIMCELLALSGLVAELSWSCTDPRINPLGGGASAYFGPATGLYQLCATASVLRRSDEGSVATIVDLGGPIGQAVTIVSLGRRQL